MPDAWYAVVEAKEPLTQGDFVMGCPVLKWVSAEIAWGSDGELDALKKAIGGCRVDVVVMTQACDLKHDKVRDVILCPHIGLPEHHEYWKKWRQKLGQNPTEKAWSSHCEALCDGYMWNLAILDSFDDGTLKIDPRIVDFREVYTVPRRFLESYLVHRGGPRLRLLAPYREHLSQAFARFFMRVGLPTPVRIAE
jgi:hypothetical protein